MAVTEFGVNHQLAVKLYSKKLFRESLKKTWASKFMGKGSDSIIQVNPELKEVGDKLTYGLRMLLTGDGIRGDATLEGNEESLVFYSDSIVLDQLRHAVRSAGKMSEQRVPYNMRDEAESALSDWFADRIDTAIMTQLGGCSNITDVKYTGMNSTVATDSAHLVVTDSDTAEASCSETASQIFSLTVIENTVVKAKMLSPAMRPLRVNGEDKWVMWIHPYQHLQLRTNTTTAQYMDIQKAAMQGGQISKNPIYTGALGEYAGVILHESTRVPWGTTATNTLHPNCSIGTANLARAIFCGAQAGVMVTGRNTKESLDATWQEKLFDYGNQLGVAGGLIFGIKKCMFNSKNFGVMTVCSYSPAP